MIDTPEVRAAIRKVERKRQLDVTFLEVARSMSKLSHCQSFKVGSVLVKDGRVLSTGYNGSPPGHVNCDDLFPNRADSSFDREKHHQWSNLHEIHAELNAILFAAKEGISINGATLYCTLQPCLQCCKNIIQAGIVRVVYSDVYDKNSDINAELKEFLEESGLSVEMIEI